MYNIKIYFYLTFCLLNSVQRVTKNLKQDHRFSPISFHSLSDLEGNVAGRKEEENNFLTMPEVLGFQKGHRQAPQTCR